MWKKLGFADFGSYVDFTFALAHGKWQEYKFVSADEAKEYLLGLSQGLLVPPPHLRGQETLPLIETTAA
ncbi:hypothetical protein MF672_051020 (plasmid) [Actinomadura sp. ATCC 31491]|uniref:Uncharacterized protein n=1 Tax=Actinomadura luzonensis TaxID=2805427 RepID=A0ABT0GBV0_9ACTN|nr:hypothetical protein [Actinomadura luzonensis]MCK2222086.1 hypothetical protein [Actinomadura luzonensis]